MNAADLDDPRLGQPVGPPGNRCDDCGRWLPLEWDSFKDFGRSPARELCLACGRLRIERLGIVFVPGDRGRAPRSAATAPGRTPP